MAKILGSKKRAEKLGQVCKAYCYDCAEHAPWEVAKVTKWVTFFNLRTLPLKKDYFIACEVCGEDFDLTKKDFNAIGSTLKKGLSLDDTKLHKSLFKRIGKQQKLR